MRSKLISTILAQAKLFLEDADEFYPFASAIDSSEKIIPIGAHLGEEFPDSNDLINFLETYIHDATIQRKFTKAAIAVDCLISKSGIKTNAVEIRFFDNVATSKEYYEYKKTKGIISFEGIDLT